MFGVLSFLACQCYYFILWAGTRNSFPKPLSAKQELECFERMKQGDWEAQNQLIEHNLRLVAHVIKKYYAADRDQEDLISIGTLGLIKAVRTFDPTKGARLATYAARCIENEVLMHFRSNRKRSCEVYLSDAIDSDKEGNSLALLDILSSEQSVDEQVEHKLQVAKLYQCLAGLDERERLILTLRYGLGATPVNTQRQIATRLGISRSYVSRIEKKAVEKLRDCFEEPDA